MEEIEVGGVVDQEEESTSVDLVDQLSDLVGGAGIIPGETGVSVIAVNDS
jgi:hypothetical protein